MIEYEQSLIQEINNIDNSTLFPLYFLGMLGTLCGGNIKMWF
jgi:hypothetical protein